ncbi:chromosome segregation ATPase [Babesia caballi]|uniref:Chromosome segregation ATPase n=1 Tax=Babesia caballi TaxID=5871 RepID=A0AAV4LSZ4_BABCB|nr:chromosome segregation ATPase [Babesia caballi]
MAEVRCGAEVEPGKKITFIGAVRRLPFLETVTPKLLEKVGVGCGGAIGGRLELLEILERVCHNLCTLPPALDPVGADGGEAHEGFGLRAAKRHVAPPILI